MNTYIVGKGDLGYIFRMQGPRSLEEIDILLANQQLLRQKVGDERAKEIDAAPHLIADADAFRIYHARARFHATWTTALAAVECSSFAAPMLGFSHGQAVLYHHRMLVVPATIATWCVTY